MKRDEASAEERDERRSSIDEPIRVAHGATTKADSALFLLVNSARRTTKEGSTGQTFHARPVYSSILAVIPR